uniref:Interferon-induced very large GTPase 1 n=1 Tax=Sphaeramia orbicularis TaxID=375764 RepID=A0A672ZNR3_9TELE
MSKWSFCKETSSAVVLVELICEKLKGSIVEAVCTKTAIDLAGEMRCSFLAFSENRLNLEKHVLKSLAEKEIFYSYIIYLCQPRRHVESFIKNEVNKYIYTDHREKAQNILKKNVDDIKNQISRALFVATEEVKTQQGDLEMWLQKFSSLLKDVLAFSSIYSENFTDVNDFYFLKKGIEERLIPVFEDMKKHSLDKMKEFREQPDQILIKQLCDCCWETCPFCAAVCTNTAKDHSPNKHSVPFHRPSGIQGWHDLETLDLCVDFCTTKVVSDRLFRPRPGSEEFIPYKIYQTAGGEYEKWLITADGSNLTYWKWFLCRFQKELEDCHHLKFEGSGEIPSDWREYTKEEAIQSLDEMYK